MIPQTSQTEVSTPRSPHYEPVAWRLRLVDSTMPYRAKEEFDPIAPLPKWISRAAIGWTIAAAAAYTAVLARWWE